ncbi:hypothetical protein, partial [Haematobacter sp.]|uniref:hypothetical protein n=1 Tax=Haematobacter sp. TaxID=2953762 RepID=UPI0028A983F8
HRIASHRIASHRIASHRIASIDASPARWEGKRSSHRDALIPVDIKAISILRISRCRQDPWSDPARR